MPPLRHPFLGFIVALTTLACVQPSVAGNSRIRGERVESPAASTTPEKGPVIEPVPVGTYSNRRAMEHVRRLSQDIGVRVRATKNERRAATYIAERLSSIGYHTGIQKFRVDGGRSRNVIASWPGAKRYPVVVGAHMDTVSSSPGANDNASGVAVMLETARIVAGRRQAKWVRFVAFGSEEFGDDDTHHVGSQTFVNRLGDRGRRRLAGMVSVDMVADGRPLLIATAGIGPRRVAQTLFRKLRRAGIGVRRRTLCDCSDNGPFERAGIPASLVWSGEEPDFHSSSDTPRNMSKKDLRRSGRAMEIFARALDRRMVAYFRRS